MVSRPCRRHIPHRPPSHSPRHSLAALAATRPRAALTAAAAARAARRYAHWGTLVLLITAGVDGVKGLGYWDKGCALGGGGGARVRTRAPHATPHRPSHLSPGGASRRLCAAGGRRLNLPSR